MDQIVIESYDEKTGTSRVKLNTKYGTFDRSVTVADEDKDVENRHDGIKFAMYLCQIDKLRAKARTLRERANGMSHAGNVLFAAAADSNCKYWNYTADSVMLVRIQEEVARDEARKCDYQADELEKGYSAMVESVLNARRAFRKKADKMKEEDDK